MSHKITDPQDMLVDDSRLAIVHPGPMIREQLEHMGVSEADAARRMGVPRERLEGVLDGLEPVDAPMADQLGKLLTTSFGQFVLRWQAEHDRTPR